MNAVPQIKATDLRQALIAAVGADAVTLDDDQRHFLAHDVFGRGGMPAYAVRPKTVAALQDAVRACAAAGVAMVPRGGGASYSDGFLHPSGGHVIFDLRGLDSIEVDEANAVVTVGAGTTWAALKAKLAERGLRTPFWGPFSGLVATVGGSVSQNTISHGSGTHGISAASVLSMDVVLASGELMRTGPSPALRHDGPDLTGLFTGDCGALGIKAAVRLPLRVARKDFAALSFAFDDFADFHAAVRATALEGLEDTHFGVDLALSQGQIGKNEGVASRGRIALEVLRSSRSPLAGVLQLLRMAKAGDAVLRAGAYLMHYIVEGIDARDAAARADRLRQVIGTRGREVPNAAPTFVRALPFAPLTNILGPRGERWVALNGILAHEAVLPFHNALVAFYADRAAEMARLHVWTGSMFMGVGTTGFLYELAIYWDDALTAYHHQVLDAEHLAKQPAYDANDEAGAYVAQLKRDLVALFTRFGAAHFQLGRAYPYLARLDPAAHGLITAVKQQLDPDGLMNPGVLGL
jgi:D-lactate dehydrogenase (cytochrome)